MPEPSWERLRVPSIRWKRSKMRASASAGMPTPVSETVRRTAPSIASSLAVMAPAKVYLKAFESRLRTTFSHMSRST